MKPKTRVFFVALIIGCTFFFCVPIPFGAMMRRMGAKKQNASEWIPKDATTDQSHVLRPYTTSGQMDASRRLSLAGSGIYSDSVVAVVSGKNTRFRDGGLRGLMGNTSGTAASSSKEPGVYVFPVRPGMPEWALFDAVEDMYAATQIPPEKLKNMETRALIETCLDYPLLVNILVYNDLQTGFDTLVERFNGLGELLARQDASTALLAKYRQMDPEDILKHGNVWSAADGGRFFTQFAVMELLLGQDRILSGLTVSEKKDVAIEALKKFETKRKSQKSMGHWAFLRVDLLCNELWEALTS